MIRVGDEVLFKGELWSVTQKHADYFRLQICRDGFERVEWVRRAEIRTPENTLDEYTRLAEAVLSTRGR